MEYYIDPVVFIVGKTGTLIVHSLSISWQLPSGGIFVQGVWLVRIQTFNSAITPFTLI